jgi:hypothetical protein
MFLMSKYLSNDNIATSQISSLLVFDTLQIASTLHKIVHTVHHAPALFRDTLFIANTAVNVRLTYARD